MRGSGRHQWPVQQVRARYFSTQENGWGDHRKMSGDLILLLDEARHIAEIPFVITSGWRATGQTSHSRGTGVDIRAHTSRSKFRIVESALVVGFKRIGVYDRHIHLDIDPASPSEVMWVGESR
jgi:zinc D-Ala-D-Ala carboxypeptidase